MPIRIHPLHDFVGGGAARSAVGGFLSIGRTPPPATLVPLPSKCWEAADALPAAVRRRPKRNAPRDRRGLDRRSVPRRSGRAALEGADRGPAAARLRARGRAAYGGAGAQELGRGRRTLLPRLRCLPPPYSGERRPHHPARRVSDQLHALSARDRAGHAADAVRIPDPGRPAVRLRGRQCVDVRWIDRDVGSHRHGAPDHAPDQNADLVGRAPALCQRRQDDGEVHRRPARHGAAGPECRNRRGAADRGDRRGDERGRRPISRYPRPDHRPRRR